MHRIVVIDVHRLDVIEADGDPLVNYSIDAVNFQFVVIMLIQFSKEFKMK